MQGHHFGVIGDASGTVGKVSTGRPRSLDIPSDARQPKLYSSLNSELPKVVEILERVQVLPCSPLPLPSPEDRGFKRFSSFVRVCNSVVGVFVGIFIQTLQWLSLGRINLGKWASNSADSGDIQPYLTTQGTEAMHIRQSMLDASISSRIRLLRSSIGALSSKATFIV